MIGGSRLPFPFLVMAKCRIGHFAEAQILEAIEIDYIDESEVLSPADDVYHIDKTKFRVPLRLRSQGSGRGAAPHQEGASDPMPGNPVQGTWCRRFGTCVKCKSENQASHLRFPAGGWAVRSRQQLQVPYELVWSVHKNGKLPVVNFAAGGVATPADAALMMQLGAEGVFVGSGIFKSKSGKTGGRHREGRHQLQRCSAAGGSSRRKTWGGHGGHQRTGIALLMAERGQ